jgi:hypothetical protein
MLAATSAFDFPATYIVEDAGEESPEKYLNDGQAEEYTQELVQWCHKEIEKAEKQPTIQAAMKLAQAKLAIPRGDKLETMMRYTAMLDRELYQGIKAFREAQELRTQSIESAVVVSADST